MEELICKKKKKNYSYSSMKLAFYFINTKKKKKKKIPRGFYSAVPMFNKISILPFIYQDLTQYSTRALKENNMPRVVYDCNR